MIDLGSVLVVNLEPCWPPSGAQEATKTPQEAPKTPPRGPQAAPKRPQEAPRGTQDAPRGPKRCPRGRQQQKTTKDTRTTIWKNVKTNETHKKTKTKKTERGASKKGFRK